MAATQVFKASYSKVPVYEIVCKGVAVMRRESDSWVNATQILKVAGFDKPQRTRILERNVQTGEHEKVQGGYGKYQGTWIPLDRAVDLSHDHDVHHLLRVLFDFVPGDVSPPPAPKHITAATNRPRKPRAVHTQKRKQVFARRGSSEQHERDLFQHDRVGFSPSSHTMRGGHRPRFGGYSSQKRPQVFPNEALTDSDVEDYDETDDDMEEDMNGPRENTYARQLLRYFMKNDAEIPEILINKPKDLDINIIIDDEGHTSLHWAAALGDLEVVEILIDQGADMSRVSYKGQTALMRSVLFTNNYDLWQFENLLDILSETLFNIDKEDKTVFHHAVSTAEWKGKVHASHFYMELLLASLKDKSSDLIKILNVQDKYGDTALIMAARIRDRSLVRMLVNAGASLEINNLCGMTAQSYIDELENSSQGSSGLLKEDEFATREALRKRVERMFQSLVYPHAPSTTSEGSMSHLFDSFAGSYERDLTHKDESVREARAELNLARQRLAATQHIFNHLAVDPDDIAEADADANVLERSLRKLAHLDQTETLSRLIQQQQKEQFEASESNTTESVEGLCKQLEALQAARRTMAEELLRLKTQAPSKRYQEYKWLISKCCDVEYENVDVMLSPLLASFNNEEPEL